MNSAADSPPPPPPSAQPVLLLLLLSRPSVREDSDDDDDNDEWPATPQTAASALAVRPTQTPPPAPAVKVRLRSERRTEENSSSSSPLSGGGLVVERDSNELRLVSARPLLGRCALLRLNRGTGGDLPPSHEISLALLSFLLAGMMSKVRKLAPRFSAGRSVFLLPASNCPSSPSPSLPSRKPELASHRRRLA